MTAPRKTMLVGGATAILVAALIFVAVSALRKGANDPWPYSAAYRALTPLSESEAEARAIILCANTISTTENVAISIGPRDGQPDYFRVVVRGKLGDTNVTHVVFVHRFNAKGDRIERSGPTSEL